MSPDPSRLGGADAGSGLDAGGGTDTGGLADVPPGLDAPTVDGGGPECTMASECNDAVDCTVDDCVAGTCAHTATDSACPGGERCNVTMGCVPIVCESAADCGDGDACNGAEACAPGTAGADPRTGCTAGTALVCGDGIACTVDGCDPASGCTHAADHAACDDGVGCTMDRCAGTAGPSGCEHLPDDAFCTADVCVTGARCDRAAGCTVGVPRDCSDSNVCTLDACDAAAAGFCSHVAVDADMDGAPARTVGGTTCASGTDCNDMSASVRPGTPEVCGNGIDDNCVGGIDEGCTVPTGENCATARPLVLSGDPTATRTARFNGAFSGFVDDYTTRCGQMGGRDAVFSLTIDRVSDVRIETSGIPIDTVLAVGAPTCDPMAFNNACNDDSDPGGPLTSRIWLHRIAPGTGGGPLTVYILVDAYSNQTGNFQLDVTVTPLHPDACGAVEQLDITGGGLVLGASGGLGSVVGGQRGSCDPDFVDTDAEAGIFRLSSPGDGSLARLTARSPSFNPVLYVRTGMCSPGTEPAGGCDVGGDLANVVVTSGTRTWVIFDGVPAGTVTPLPYTLVYDP